MQNNIRAERKARGISLDEFSKYTGYSIQAIGTWETGTREPNIATITKIADLFDVSIDYLLGRTNNKLFLKDGITSDEVISAMRIGEKALDSQSTAHKQEKQMSDEEFDKAVQSALQRLIVNAFQSGNPQTQKASED